MGKRKPLACAAAVAAALFVVVGGASAARTGDKIDRWGPDLPNGGAPRADFTITFDEGVVAPGATLSNQYAAQGVTFSPGAGGASGVTNPPNGSAPSAFVDMTISDVATEAPNGVGAPLAGNVLHSFAGWLNEDGNAMFTMTFSSPVTAVGADFGGNFFSDSGLFAVDTVTNSVYASAFMGPGANDHAQLNLAVPTTKVVVVIGAFDDYVAFDNLTFSTTGGAVPEPASLSLLTVGALGMIRRTRR